MRWASLAVVALAFAVAAPAYVEADRTRTSETKKKKSIKKKKKKSSKHKKTTKRSSRKSKSKSKSKRDDRKKVAANMPKGWSWPPTRAMLAAGEACTKKLDELGIAWTKPDVERDAKIVTPVAIKDMKLGGVELVSVYKKGPHPMDCHLALGLATYGPTLAALGVKEIRFSSIYRNTKVRVNGQTKNVLSRHALGLAIDVRSFVDIAGREAVVEIDYNAADPMLLSIEQAVNDTGGFRTVLTPRNDPLSHHDHFHLEIAVEYPTEPKKPDI